MASLNGQTIASSYEQLLHTDTDGGGNGNTLVTIKDGDNGTVFGLKLATNKVEVIPSAADDANAFEVSQNDGTAVFTVDTSTPSATFTSDVFIAENIKHTGDTDTRIRMLNDNVIIYAGNENQVDIGNAITVFNEGGGDNDLRIESSGNANMFYVDAGNNRVGIGTASPSSSLEISKSVSAGSAAKDTAFLTLSATDAGVNMSGGEGASILFKIPDDETNPSIGASIAGIKENSDDSLSQTALSFNVSQNDETLDEAMRIASDGKVGIGTTSPSEVLQVNHSASDGDSGILIVNESTSIANDTFLGGIGFDSADGNIPSTVGEASAAIVARSAEAHGTGDKGGNLLFLTSAIDDDDDTGSHERMRITSGGHMYLGGTASGGTPALYFFNNDSARAFIQASGTSMKLDSDSGFEFHANNGASRIDIDSSGRLGIGHTSPQYGITMAQGTADGQKIGWEDGSNNKRGAILVNSDNDSMEFMTGTSDAVRMRITSAGVIGIESGDSSGTGATKGIHIDTNGVPFIRYQETNSSGGTADFEVYVANGQYILYDVDDSASVYSVSTSQVISGDFNDTSDIGLKENIKTIDSGLSVVNKLNPVTFDWKNKKKGSNSGFIAQEVEKLLPDDVEGKDFNTDYPSGRIGDVIENEDKGFNNLGKSINMGGIVAHLTKAIQELSAQNDALTARIEALEA